ncbi:MAG: hypothetical protein JSU74_00850 [Candidatus Zixiibacteriota bacterium]|nr:MAG: hypothetical protein JSU74_00850 [candidate division Zixibacteria bacterium]
MDIRGRLHRATGNDLGISLIEVTMLVVIVAIAMAVAMKSMTPAIENARQRKTEHEMDIIIKAIAGDESVMSVAGGVRADFGYVGDVGAFPPDLDALAENPGSYGTWNGPYIPPDHLEGFRTDEWGQAYSYNGGLEVVSNGSGSPMRHRGGNDSLDILSNTVYGVVRDLNDSLPGTAFDDSVDVEITIPDGAGSTTTKSYHPDSTGAFTLDSIPIGRHLVEAIYTPEVDTLSRYLTVLPRHNSDDIVIFNFASAWFSTAGTGDSMLTLVAGSDSVYGVACHTISFDVANNTGGDVTVSSITLTWVGPTAYYQFVYWGGTKVFDSSAPRHGSGELTTFDMNQTISNGDTVTVVVDEFRDSDVGGSSRENMGSTDFTVEFSDGSVIEFTTAACP